MSTAGILAFQHCLDQRDLLDDLMADGLWRILKRYETQGRTAFDPGAELPRTWQYLGDTVDHLIASSPWTSDDPVAVLAREIAPHLVVEAWCDRHRVLSACGHVAEQLSGVAAFTVYDECGMAAGKTRRDFGGRGTRPSVLVQTQTLCMGLALQLLEYAADDDLERDG